MLWNFRFDRTATTEVLRRLKEGISLLKVGAAVTQRRSASPTRTSSRAARATTGGRAPVSRAT